MRSKKAVYNIITNLFLQIVTIIYGFIVPKVILNNFGSSVNGLISSITQFLAYITLLESGFGPVVKASLYKPIANKNKSEISNILKSSERFFRKIAYILLLYIVVLCFLYPILVSKNFDWIYTTSLIIIIGISTFAEYFFGMTYRLFLQASQKSYITSIIHIVTYVISIVSILIMAKLKIGVHIIKLVSGIIFLFRPLLQNMYVRKKYNINFKEVDSHFELKQKWDGLAQHIAAVIHSNTDITLLTIFTSLAEVSVYSVYFLVIKGIKSIIQAFTTGIDAVWGDMIAKREKTNLNKKFNIYEILYGMLSTVTFTSTIILIVPFISVYTKGITDTNYIRYLFGVLIVVSEYIWAIRLPYSSITLAAGHFKETRKGAWVECLSNIIISTILVWKYGLIGVTIGTIVAMTIRTIEFVYHTNKYILERSMWESVKKILLVIVQTLIIVFICKCVPFLENANYFNWVINAVIVGAISCVVVLIFNYFIFKKEFKEIIVLVKSIFKKEKIEGEIF